MTEKLTAKPPVTITEYPSSGHFIEAVFENWKSEFLQMGAYILLTIFLFQKGSSESKNLGTVERVEVSPNSQKIHRIRREQSGAAAWCS